MLGLAQPTSGERMSVLPTLRSGLISMLNTPAGKPAREMISARAQAEEGTRSAGTLLIAAKLPHISQPDLHAGKVAFARADLGHPLLQLRQLPLVVIRCTSRRSTIAPARERAL